jgi:hypothetical protein
LVTNRRSPDLVRELDRLDAIVFELLVTQPWLRSLNNITEKEIKEQLSRLFVDTAAAMLPALGSGRKKHVQEEACGVWIRLWCAMLDGGDDGGESENILKHEGLTK